jgi:hypothetical protein
VCAAAGPLSGAAVTLSLLYLWSEAWIVRNWVANPAGRRLSCVYLPRSHKHKHTLIPRIPPNLLLLILSAPPSAAELSESRPPQMQDARREPHFGRRAVSLSLFAARREYREARESPRMCAEQRRLRFTQILSLSLGVFYIDQSRSVFLA